jgi:plastocyanin
VSAPHTYHYTFNALGTFHYHCQAHGGSGMVGTVTVVASAP